MSFTYSVQLYSVRTVLFKEPLHTLHELKRMGYIGVEGFGNFVLSASDIKYGVAETGLKIVGYHTPWSLVQDDKLESTIKYFKEIGNKYVIVPSLPAECTNSIDAWKRTADKFNELSKRLQVDGLMLGYHNHASEFKMIDGELPFTVFFDNTDPSVVMQMDNGNALSGGADLMAIMKRYPGRARSVHLKPYSKSDGFAPVIGKDDIDWKEFMHWCRDSGGTEHFIVEYEEEKVHPQMEGVDLCIKGLQELEAQGKI
ncbi:MAG: sugar phosphate isomerase/epimerase [Treponema sp.]|jgi:sugar phosphate isomerase/epimerase|nr:sugar phosphate isomerase/epimerase [Treponema sp.]